MDANIPAWYCLRSLQKNEHIAAASLRAIEGVEAFNPQLRVQKSTRTGPRWYNEPLFPSYVFAKFALRPSLDAVRFARGVNYVVSFGGKYPAITDAEIEDLRIRLGGECCERPPDFVPGDEVQIVSGSFMGLNAVVQRFMPATQRVRVLLEMLGRSTAVELHAAMVSSPRHYPEQLLNADTRN